MLIEAYFLNGNPNNPNNSKDPYYLPYAALSTNVLTKRWT